MATFVYEFPSFPSETQNPTEKFPLTNSFSTKLPIQPPSSLLSKSITPYWLHIPTLRDEFKYSDTYKQNIKILSKSYCGWKRVRGDGNCYYRSVISTYFQKIFHFNQPENRIFEFLSQIYNLTFYTSNKFYSECRKVHEVITDLYQARINSTYKEKVEIFFKVLEMLQDETFDSMLIKLARAMTGCLIDLPDGAYIKEFSTSDEIYSLHYRIMELGQEAEGLELSLLPKALNIQVIQVNIFAEKILYSSYPDEAAFTEKIKINIISKSRGHYDALYSIQDMEDEDYSLKARSYMIDNRNT